MKSSESFFRKDGPLASGLPGFEEREQQVQMVLAVEDAIASGRHLIVEAGTGVGKSLAYLVPFIRWAVEKDRRVVVSTYTRALQNQLFVKDLPFLKKTMGMDIRFALCMGSDNYLCLKKAEDVRAALEHGSLPRARKSEARKILSWAGLTESGLMTDMDFSPPGPVWKMFSREPDLCAGRSCVRYEECFYRKARQLQAASHVLVANHSLLFTNMVSEARVLPDFDALVLDEAHTLEDVATGYFGVEFSRTALDALGHDVADLAGGLADASMSGTQAYLKDAAEALERASGRLYASVGSVYGTEAGSMPFIRGSIDPGELWEILPGLSAALLELGKRLPDNDGRARPLAYFHRAERLAGALEFIFGDEEDRYVYWTEVRVYRKKINYVFHAAPVDISMRMKEYIFDRVCPVVLTSATLSVSDGTTDFGFIKERLGVEDPLELALDSPFDYGNRVLLYLPEKGPDPGASREYEEYLAGKIAEIYAIMGGRIFVLFTSYDMMNRVSEKMASEANGEVNILRQGDMPRYVLLDVFKRKRDTMLFGTTTFWQGVDVPGSGLECVIITRLPFTVPSDPVNAARIRSIRDAGGNPFEEYQLPQAIIMFKQGFGRLIRSCSDRGVVAVLDGRIRRRSYGSRFIKALPGCGSTGDMDRVRGFLEGSG